MEISGGHALGYPPGNAQGGAQARWEAVTETRNDG
jgi:hypothetical protein